MSTMSWRGRCLRGAILGVLGLAAAAPAQTVGPDVTLRDIQSVVMYGPVAVTGRGNVRAYSISSHTCNIGSQNLSWINSGTPALGMNAYRLHNGRLMQIGVGNCKTACCAAAGSGCGTCNGSGGSVLGAGCQDVYGASYNAGQTRLAPRSVINGFSGAIASYPATSGDAIFRRLQVMESDMSTTNFPGARFFVEGVYVATDDAQAGNGLNNATYRPVTIDATYNMVPAGTATTQVPAIQAWRDHGLGLNQPDPSVTIGQVDVPGEGRFWYGSKVTSLGNGRWRYDYAIYNLNSDRGAGYFYVPIPPDVTVSGTGINQPWYHSGEPASFNSAWTTALNGCTLKFEVPEKATANPNSSSIRWGTMFNFWFEATTPPATGSVKLGLFKPGAANAPTDVSFLTNVPSAIPCWPDYNSDANIDQDDIVVLVNVVSGARTATCGDPDFNLDGNVDQDDVYDTINRIAGGNCP